MSEPITEIDTRFSELAISVREQLRLHIAPELAAVPKTDRERLLDTVHCLVSWDAFDWHRRILGRSDDEIRQTSVYALNAVLR